MRARRAPVLGAVLNCSESGRGAALFALRYSTRPTQGRSPEWVIRVAPTGSKASPNVCYAFNSDRICASQRTDAMCHVWTAPSWQGVSSRSQAGRCSHVFGLLARHTRPLAIMPSADQVPVKSPHSTMHWHMWVVLIARIDRLCITCCSPSQPSHHAGCPARFRYAASATGSL